MGIKKLLGHNVLLFLAIIYTLLVTVISLINFNDLGVVEIKVSDKIGHAIAYFIFTLTWFLFFFYSERLNLSYLKSLSQATLFCFVFGLLMEACQACFTKYRYAEWLDVAANSSGIIIAVILMLISKKIMTKLKV